MTKSIIRILMSEQGDWIRVETDDEHGDAVLLYDGHSVGSLDLQKMLVKLGFVVDRREASAEELYK